MQSLSFSHCNLLTHDYRSSSLLIKVPYLTVIDSQFCVKWHFSTSFKILNMVQNPCSEWVAPFGISNPKVIPLEVTGTQFEIYNKISRNYSHSFLFESLTGPEELAETSLMGFDPSIIIKGYHDKVSVESKDGKIETIQTDDPLKVLKQKMGKISEQSYRYLGGAVGVINYDAIRLWEKIPQSHRVDEPLMEFGIYTDGILYDNKEKKSLYFYYDKNRVDQIKISDTSFEQFKISDIKVNLDNKNFTNIVNKTKKYIYDGDIFQGVLSRRFSFEASGDHLKVYKMLRALNPSPYLYHMKMKNRIIIGSSPEMLIRVTGNVVETFPIAGTRKITDDESKNEQLEQESRGPYAGAVGYFSFNGCCDFAIAIRSIFFDGKKGFVQAGAGIVTDSIAENEIKETEHKAEAMLAALKEAAK